MIIIKNSRILGSAIKEARRRQNLTQEQLSAVCGVGLRFLRELEGGKESCHLGKAMHVIAMLGMQLTVDNGDLEE